ncbi:hypothetical protein DND132_2682 [Pseudodesulfovibrio mercurii]|uniref:Lipoprotein n=1 Tax=Pseudodesulfovibrio mercurii TaxID=641491 RepID=F0JIY6_9BACT|nr:hypothetical protein [Pseudodesulfovibrio mercurii]EGB15885.1 hypothetical protein DND132_2682 [Pseudodesulfovibrio mercurii]
MRALTSALLSLLVLCCLAACGNDVADDPKLSEEGKEVVQAVGGPFDAAEFKKFLKVLPEIPGLTAQNAGDGSGVGMSAAVKSAIASHGWDENRFLYIYGHAMVMANYEQMQGMTAQLQDQFKDLPEDQRKAMEQMMSQQVGGQVDAFKAEVDKQVPASEQAVIRDNMDALMTAVGMR